MASRLLVFRPSKNTNLFLANRVSRLLSSTTNIVSPHERYNSLVEKGIIVEDEHQLAALDKLDSLFHSLLKSNYSPPKIIEEVKLDSEEKGFSGSVSGLARTWGVALGGGSENPSGAGGVKVSTFGAPKDVLEESNNSFSWWPFGKNKSNDNDEIDHHNNKENEIIQRPPGAPAGIYMYGGVGTGKTYVMDIFYDCLPVKAKRRVHFNKFMLDVHHRLHALRPKAVADSTLTSGVGKTAESVEDPMSVVVSELMEHGWLLCFDEFQVTDIADALILKSLFSKMIEKGAVIVATSNRPPTDLYKNGLQRNLFLPFIDLINNQLTVHSLAQSRTDYRLIKSKDTAADTYFIASNPNARSEFEKAFVLLSGDDSGTTVPMTLRTQGRAVDIPRACVGKRMARFNFNELCGKPVGAADYICIAEVFHTIFLEDVPKLSLRDINPLRRLIVLIDTFYDHKVKLVVLAAAAPLDLFNNQSVKAEGEDEDHGDLLGDATYLQKNFDEVFAFDRTVSRLLEMQSMAYLKEAAHSFDPPGLDVLNDLLKNPFSSNPSSNIMLEHQLFEGEEGQKALEKIWLGYDVNGDGIIDQIEFGALMNDLQNLRFEFCPLTETSNEKILKKDNNNDEILGKNKEAISSKVLHAYFSAMDMDGDGVISKNEFFTFAKQTGLRRVH